MINNLVDKYLCNKWAIWCDAIYISIMLLYLGISAITNEYVITELGMVILGIIPPFLLFIYSIRGMLE